MRRLLVAGTELAKNTKISMVLSGWPAAAAIVGSVVAIGATIAVCVKLRNGTGLITDSAKAD